MMRAEESQDEGEGQKPRDRLRSSSTSLHLPWAVVNSHLLLFLFYLSSPSISICLSSIHPPPAPSLHPSLQLSQCNVNDVPSIASDSARTLTSPPPPLHRLVIFLFLFFSHPFPHSLSPLLLFSSTSLFFSPHSCLPRSPAASHACHLSSVPLPSFSSLLSPAIIYVSLFLHCSLGASAVSSCLCHLLSGPLFISPPRLSISLLSLQSIFCLPASLKGAQTTSTGLLRLHFLLFHCLT